MRIEANDNKQSRLRAYSPETQINQGTQLPPASQRIVRHVHFAPARISSCRERDLQTLAVPRALWNHIGHLHGHAFVNSAERVRSSILRLTVYRAPSLKKSDPSSFASQTVSSAVLAFLPSDNALASFMRRTRKPRTSRGGNNLCRPG